MIQISRISCRAIVLAAALGVLSLDAAAAMKLPADRNETVEATLDRGAPQGDVMVFSNASGGYDTAEPEKWGRNSWTCQSATATADGACPTEPIWVAAGNSTDIRLSFTEQQTGAKAVLTLQGESAYLRHVDCNGKASPEVTSIARTPVHMAQSATVANCPTNSITWDGRSLFVKIPAEELKKLPSGGTWKANLRLNLRLWGASNVLTLATFRAAIKLNTTDKNNIQVYLPEFTNATPTVDLKLRKLPNGSRMAGTSNVDMCLYDGYNSQSTWFDVSASDGLTIDRRDKGQYSVLLASDKSGAYESRVDYTASLTYAGKKIVLPNNETVRLQGVNNSAGRSVSLPGISVPVVCTPTPLTLETPEFQSVWKRPGKYSNKLTITFTPSSASL
ncbi:putative minor pilin and initiator [Burkholderia aenigmatica]|uniref:Minor pilin and initiator n=2 Tax=Burkholderia TaxID=32008 RepID=A0ABY6XSV5_9BURK|nr:CfaE/CblD family pilus tip adhesin [Burkholderia aenigmatica]VWC75942.1 putative minor pilin and initiator [Burkholderia aenigmatica]VWD33141.1 putative minor pilin and initiator [Burkholderia aenigmatica]